MKSIKRHIIYFWVPTIILAGFFHSHLVFAEVGPVSKNAVASDVKITREEITSADVFQRAQVFQNELKLICYELGVSQAEAMSLQVSNAEMRDVYYQAIQLFERSRELSIEYQGYPSTDESSLFLNDPQAFDVWTVMGSALEYLNGIKKKLGTLNQEGDGLPRDNSNQPNLNNLLTMMIQLNHEMDAASPQGVSLSDGYQGITFAIGYSARLLSVFPDAKRIPDAPPIEHGKRLIDVKERLIQCDHFIREIARVSQVPLLSVEQKNDVKSHVTSSDIYDFSFLLVAKLSALHNRLKDSQALPEAYFSGQKIPAQLHQRAGILEDQLSQLVQFVKANPKWLETTEMSHE